MDFRADLNLKDLKLNWRKRVYVLAGVAIAGILVFAVFRSFVFLAGQLAATFQIDEAGRETQPGFDAEGFGKIKDRLE